MKRNYNKHELKVMQLIHEEIDYLVGGYENTLLDFPKDHEAYKEAYSYLYETPAAKLLEEFYDILMERCKPGSYDEHAKFAGSEFIRAKLGLYIIKNRIGKEFHTNQ